MNAIIKIIDNGENQAVSAKELYEFLEVKRDFSSWCKQMFEYGFEEARDYVPIMAKNEFSPNLGKTPEFSPKKAKNPKGGRPAIDYALALDCAKEISMLQRSEKGKQARQYFIEVEKKARALSEAVKKPENVFDVMEMSLKRLREQSEQINQIRGEVQDIKIATATRPDYFTVVGYAILTGRHFPYQAAVRIGKIASAYCRERGYETGKTTDPRFGYVKTYPREALRKAVEQYELQPVM